MFASLFDNEVEKYLGFAAVNHEMCSRQISATPGRFRDRRASSENVKKRPSSACSVFSPDMNVSTKVADIFAVSPKTPKSLKSAQYKGTSKCKRKKNASPLKTPKTPKESDRFIPPRASMNFQSSHHKMMQVVSDDIENYGYHNTPSANNKHNESKQFEQGMKDNIRNILGDSNNTRILQYQAKGNNVTQGK